VLADSGDVEEPEIRSHSLHTIEDADHGNHLYFLLSGLERNDKFFYIGQVTQLKGNLEVGCKGMTLFRVTFLG
jgi:hypothetical protein